MSTLCSTRQCPNFVGASLRGRPCLAEEGAPTEKRPYNFVKPGHRPRAGDRVERRFTTSERQAWLTRRHELLVGFLVPATVAADAFWHELIKELEDLQST